MTEGSPVAWHRLSSREGLAAALAGYIRETLVAEIETSGQASLAVSGGTTPDLFFLALASTTLPWEKVVVTLADERDVPETAARSNAGLVRDRLLQGKAAAARFVPFVTSRRSLEDNARATSRALADIPWPLTAVVLGMGRDGHTASLFPRAEGLAEALNPSGRGKVTAIRSDAVPEARLTLTLPSLMAAKTLVLHIEGQEKLEVIEAAMTPGAIEDLPIRAIFREKISPLPIFWCP